MVTEKSCNLLEYEWTSHKNEEEESLHPVQINIYQSNTYRKDLIKLASYISTVNQGFKKGSK